MIIQLKSKIKTRVKYADTDSMGVVNNGAYNDLLELARTELMRNKSKSLKELEELGYYMPLIESRVKYISPARYDDELEIVTLCEISKESPYIVFKSIMKRNQELISKGITKHILVDINTFKCKRLSNIFF